MSNSIKGVALWIAFFGCSGEMLEEEVEFESTSQAFSAPTSLSYQMGTQTGSSRQRCTKTDTGQTCSIPDSTTMTWCIDSTLSSTFKSLMTTALGNLDSALSNWVFQENLDIFGTCDQATAKVLFVKGSVGSSGTGSSNVFDYVRSDFNVTTILTSSPGVAGFYQKHRFCRITVDENDITAKGTSTTEDNNGRKHAGMHGWLGCLGIGGVNTANSQASRNNFNLADGPVAVSIGEGCALQAYSATNNGTFSNSGSCASD